MSEPTFSELLHAWAERGAAAQEVRKTQSAILNYLPSLAGALPNCVLRSALFGISRVDPVKPEWLQCQKIESLSNIEIIYTGPRLDQCDLDVWDSILRWHGCGRALGDVCAATAYRLLKLQRRSDDGRSRHSLAVRMDRLCVAFVRISAGNARYEGKLIEEVLIDELTGEYLIRLNPRLQGIFRKDGWTQIDSDVRGALIGRPLAQWLFGFYSTHAAPLPLKIETIHRLCGSSTMCKSSFRQQIIRAFELVNEAVSLANGGFFSAEINQGMVLVSRLPSRTQKRHIRNKAARKGACRV